MHLSVVLPAYNEEATIADVIARVPRHVPGISRVNVIVIDDGSTDRTRELALAAGAEVISHPANRGVGAAFQTGIERVIHEGAHIMVNMDADGQFDPADIAMLIEPIIEGVAECVTASRFMKKEFEPQMSRVKFWGNKAMSILVSRMAGQKFYDVSCGFRAYTFDVLMRLNLFGHFTYTQETILELTFKGIQVWEVPIRVQGTRKHGASRVASNLFAYAFNTSKIIFRSFRDYKPMLVFGALSVFMFIVAGILGAFLGIFYLRHNTFSPHKWAGFTAGFFGMLGVITFVTGLLADMLARMRITQERILYLLRRRS